jgi:Flp pilus assembly protein TadB
MPDSRCVPERNGQIDAPTEIAGQPQTTAPDPFGATPAALSEQLKQLRRQTEALEQELQSERERRAKVQAAYHRQRAESRRLYEECARLRTELEQGDHHLPQPAWDDRPVNPALRTKWRWVLRLLALLVLVVVLGAVYLVIHAFITHESIQHVWSQVRSPF